MNTLKTILVPVDFSTGSRSALDQAMRLSGINAAKLHVLHVVDTEAVSAMAAGRQISVERQSAVAHEGAKVALARWLAQAGAPSSCESTVVMGVPLHEILEKTKALQADLLVAGSTGSGETLTGAGSLACKLARNAPCKVLLVRANHPQAFKKVVACIDFSDTSREVLAQARRVALQDGAAVDYVHVWQEPWLSTPYAYLAEVAAEHIAETQQTLRATLSEFVQEEAEVLAANEVLVKNPSYANGIAEHATDVGADLIVVGAKGRTNLRYVLLGSTAENLLKTLPCSLLVVKPFTD